MATRTIRVDSTEYLNIALTGPVSDDAIEISFNDGVTWHAAEHTAGGVRVLVGPAGDFMLTPGMLPVLVRIHDIPEVPVIPAGAVYVTT